MHLNVVSFNVKIVSDRELTADIFLITNAFDKQRDAFHEIKTK